MQRFMMVRVREQVTYEFKVPFPPGKQDPHSLDNEAYVEANVATWCALGSLQERHELYPVEMVGGPAVVDRNWSVHKE